MLSPKFLAASILALGLGDAPVVAQGATRTDAETQFRQLDRDNKGYLTRVDVAADPRVAQRFAKFDANRDGKLDRVEFASLISSMK